ncbi:MAG: hypothetical protein Q9O62_07105 [Ardenticatenia bacterium]|nr:hypothetical protein [Ardenticatenia bacterium]
MSRTHTGWRSMGFLYGVALVAVTFVLVGLVPVPPHDFWWYLRLGQEIVADGAIPAVDTFSWTQQGAPMVYHSWLSAVLLYTLYRWGELPLVVAANGASVAALFGLSYLTAWRASGAPKLAALATVVGLLMSSNNWAVRPQAFALPLFGLVLALCWPLASGMAWSRWLLWGVPALVAIWVNLHGSFVLALMVVGGVWTGELGRAVAVAWRARCEGGTFHVRSWDALGRRPTVGLSLLMGLVLLTTLINPRGLGAWAYVVRLITDPPSQAFIVEWQPPRPTTPQGALFFASLVGLFFVLAWARRRPRLPELLILALLRRHGADVHALRHLVRGCVALHGGRPLARGHARAAAAPLSSGPPRRHSGRAVGPSPGHQPVDQGGLAPARQRGRPGDPRHARGRGRVAPPPSQWWPPLQRDGLRQLPHLGCATGACLRGHARGTLPT